MRFRTENRPLVAFSYASLTDVVLQLLIFFLLSSGFVIQSGLRVHLPKATSADQGQKSEIIITVAQSGAMSLNNQAVTPESLRGELAALLNGDPSRLIIIQADRSVSLQQAVLAMDIAKSAGATKFLIATQPHDRP